MTITSFRIPIQPELIATLKRTAETIYERGGIIRKLDNLGFRDLPCKMSKDRTPYRQANQFIYTFDVPPQVLADLNEEYRRDVDIIRQVVYKIKEPEPHPCTLHTEMKEPAYREDVQKLLQLDKKKEEKRWLPQSGIDYYPFQR